MGKNWWEVSTSQSMKLTFANIVNGLLQDSFVTKKTIYTDTYSGEPGDISTKEFTELLVKELNVLHNILYWSQAGEVYQTMYVSENSFLDLSNRAFMFASNDKILFDKFVELCKQHIIKSSNKNGAVNVLVQGANSMYLSTIGVGGVQLKEDNYNASVVAQYNKVIADLKSKDPVGRITILSGEPGTGKTHMIRGLLNECNNASFVFIPSFMVSNLSGPSLIPILAEEAENGKPIVIIIEDADSCLIKRQTDNHSEVSTLLNLGDGILGSLLDIRIICTTNAKQLDIDPALKRNGRLSQMIEVGKLDAATANKLLSSLIGKEIVSFHRETTLADVYAAAKEMKNGN